MTINCDQCHKPFAPTRPNHRFCTNRCRSAWHHAQNLPGTVTGIRALRRGGWSVTIHVPDVPYDINIGTPVRLETTPLPRQNASSAPERVADEQGHQPAPETRPEQGEHHD